MISRRIDATSGPMHIDESDKEALLKALADRPRSPSDFRQAAAWLNWIADDVEAALAKRREPPA